MAEQCIVCLDTLLHAVEPPPPLPDDSGSPSNTATSTSTAATTATTATTTTTADTASTASTANATTTVLTINTLVPFDSGKSEPPTALNALAAPEPSSAGNAAIVKLESRDADEVDIKPVLANGEIYSSDSKSLEDDNVAVIQICGHTLHNTCLKEWTAKANSCPICRQNFNFVEVYDKIGGTQLSTYTVEDKKQVAEFDAQAIFDDYGENLDDEISTPCPVCGRDDHEEVLLLCDGCDTAYHTHCIGLESVPEGAWFCMECVSLFGDAVVQPAAHGPPAGLNRNASRRTGTSRSRRDFFPRTRHSMRRVDRRARSEQWQGAWGQITGHVWDALNIDLDHDEDDALEQFRRVERRRDNEQREFRRWQERLDIARRLGAQHIFERSIPSAILQHASRHGSSPRGSSSNARTPAATVQQSQEERRAWGDFERARERDQPAQSNSRKRKSRSTTGSPVEPQPEPERKLKRPRTRRIGAPSEAGPSTSAPADRAPTSAAATSTSSGGPVSVFSPVSASSPPPPSSPPPAAAYSRRNTIITPNISAPSMRSPPPHPDQPSFLSSLLKEVEMSTPSDDDTVRCLFGEAPQANADPQSPAASSPAASAMSSPRAMSTTPPPHRTLRASSPTTLSSHILPVYPPANYSPTRSAASPGSGGENSDSDEHSRNIRNRNRNNSGGDNHRSPSAVEIRQPRPRRMPSVSMARSQDTSPSRHSLSLEMKENISSIVRTALKPHWKSNHLTADQYAAINRDVSRKLYDEVTNPAIASGDMRRVWEQKASREVARAVAELQA